MPDASTGLDNTGLDKRGNEKDQISQINQKDQIERMNQIAEEEL
jgi:hypothetical protein